MVRVVPHIAVIAAMGFFSVPASAGFYSGSELLEVCTADRNKSNYFEKTYECVAYIAGAVDSFNTTRAVNNLNSCIPAGVTINQLKNVTVDFMRAHRTGQNASASAIVFSATRKAWPCRKKK